MSLTRKRNTIFMKDSSMKKLSEVYNRLAEDNNELAEMIMQVIRAESPKASASKKFDLFGYVAKGELRPSMKGVFHEEGFQVASDEKIMVAVKQEYPKEYEGKILMKDGTLNGELKYPKWRSVIPDGEGYYSFHIDAEKFYEGLDEIRTEYKAKNGKGKRWCYDWIVNVGPANFRAELFGRLITAMKELGTNHLMVKDRYRAAYAKTDDGIVLLMPTIQNQVEGVIKL